MREKLAIKNGAITLFCQAIDVILGFVVRKLFITYLGMTYLGINGTFASILNTLSLAELGFESAVIYNLYRPMREKDKNAIEEIIVILKRIYEVVGVFIVVAGIGISFLLPNFLKDVTVTPEIRAVFYLQLAGTAVTYFLAYKRTFLLALQKDYIRSVINSVVKIAATTVQIIVLLNYPSFILYTVIGIFQNFLTNLIMAVYVDKTEMYNFKSKKINRGRLRAILNNVKDIFIGKIAGYIYSSTDNLILSSFVSVTSVGLLGNYTQILYQIRSIVSNALNSTRPIIGHFLTSNESREHSFEILKRYTFLRYVISMMLLVPGYVLCDCFIASWIGSDYTLGKTVSMLLTADIFIHFVHGALVDYISGLGYFRQDRAISIVGAVINLAISLGLVNVIGIYGVLLGTVVSQTFFWISRSVIVFRDHYEWAKGYFRTYWMKSIVYFASYLLLSFGIRSVFERIPMADSYLKFIAGGVLCYVVIIPVMALLYFRTDEFSFVLGIIRKTLHRSKS